MKSLKSIILSILIAFSLASFSSIALAAFNDQVVAKITTHIDEAIKSIDTNDDTAAVAHIKEAKRARGELNSEGNAAKIGRLTAHFSKAKKLLKKSDSAGAIAELEKAKHGYNSIQF